MKKTLMAIFIAFFSLAGHCDSIPIPPEDQEITYPPRQKPTEWREIQNNWDSLVWSIKDLGGTITTDIKQRGLRKSISTHKRFYFSIFLFGILTLIWLRNKSKGA